MKVPPELSIENRKRIVQEKNDQMRIKIKELEKFIAEKRKLLMNSH